MSLLVSLIKSARFLNDTLRQKVIVILNSLLFLFTPWGIEFLHLAGAFLN